MAQRTILICDGCGAEKREVNHWFGVGIYGEEFAIRPFASRMVSDSIYCGQACVIRALSEHMDRCRETEKTCQDTAPIGTTTTQ